MLNATLKEGLHSPLSGVTGKKEFMVLIRFFVAFILLLDPAFAASAKKNSIQFKNFSESVTFEPIGKDLYQHTDASLKIQIAPRLIVKTSQAFADELMALAPEAIEVTDLFLMTNFRYFLLQFAQQESMLQVLNKLQAHPKILLVQPDLQQRRSKAEKISGNTGQALNYMDLPDYLSLVKNKRRWPGQGGAGLTVAVIDSGFGLQHSEFAGLNIGLHYDFSSKQLVKNTAVTPINSSGHGTKIAGILFGAHNQKSPEGLVPNARLIAINQPDTWTSQTLQGFYIAALAKADVINCSWHSQWLLEPVKDVVDELSQFGRDGKGTAVVFAAGNGGQQLRPGQHEASIPNAIVVGALGGSGRPQKSSNFGDLIDIWVTGEKIISTDVGTGYSYFSGTSLSAAIVSGYVALIIDSNPALNLAQIEHQLKQLLD